VNIYFTAFHAVLYLCLILKLITILLAPWFFTKIIFKSKHRKYGVWLVPFMSIFMVTVFALPWIFFLLNDDFGDIFSGFHALAFLAFSTFIGHTVYTSLVYLFFRWDEKQPK